MQQQLHQLEEGGMSHPAKTQGGLPWFYGHDMAKRGKRINQCYHEVDSSCAR